MEEAGDVVGVGHNVEDTHAAAAALAADGDVDGEESGEEATLRDLPPGPVASCCGSRPDRPQWPAGPTRTKASSPACCT